MCQRAFPSDGLTIGVADNVCFWVGLPQDPVTPGGNISSHLGQTEKGEEDTVGLSG